MKLIIDIPEETYNAVMGDEWIDSEYIYNIINSIQNGTPLPKGHGRLIDADALIFNADYYEPLISKRDFDFAPTIIEADKGE